jgi:hypothetical protein
MTVYIARVNVTKSPYTHEGVRDIGVYLSLDAAANASSEYVTRHYRKGYFEVEGRCTLVFQVHPF